MERESTGAQASKPDPRELAQWVGTIRALLIEHHQQTGAWLTVVQIIERLASSSGG